ncbi:sensor histidine kinase [Egicoccus sp. AB-alg6-2]|uniref:sensor histidine kinase n=1 Tax=Egicoccus sp. AB-alg6-2 TaxID=3242692 RepID=UPI00359E230A
MVGHGISAFWDEPRPTYAPARVWRDWALVGAVAVASVVEVGVREDRTGLPVALAVSAVVGLTLLWRRTRPLAAVAVAFGTLIVFDVARIFVMEASGLASIAAVLVLPYALCRWASGREAGIGLVVIIAWLGITHVADPTSVAEVVAGYGFFLCSAAVGASIRFHDTTRQRDVEQARLRQRHDLARDLHDAVGHHVSGIVLQAQAGRALADNDPERALTVLATIEEAASRALEEMRAVVGVLRDGNGPDLAPQPDVHHLEQLARHDGSPRIEVARCGDFADLPQPVGVALYRIAQEAVTNATRHAHNATRVTIEVTDRLGEVRLTVRDDGDPVAVRHPTTGPGFGLVGMRERAALLGGTVHAGPAPDRGWIVDATLPRRTRAVDPADAADAAERSV